MTFDRLDPVFSPIEVEPGHSPGRLTDRELRPGAEAVRDPGGVLEMGGGGGRGRGRMADPEIASEDEMMGMGGRDPFRPRRRDEQLTLADPTDNYSEIRFL